ncbi:MAG: AzlC family ABC transporter permease [Acetobacteraceae bacterium]|nr:AzlC family ABC transporter permease [Acetobacteraceae bacterium]
MSRLRPRFSRAAVLAGARRSIPMQIGVVPFALVVGIVGQGQGLSLLEITLMSALCYAGSAQLLALGHWAVPAPVLGAATAAFVVNLRMALMGPVIGPWLDRIRGWKLWATLFVMADQNWALSVAQMQAGRWDAGFLFGSGALMWLVWVVFTAVGHLVGTAIRPPPGHPIFFAALAVFVSILAMIWRGRRDVLPWAVAAAVALLIARALPGTSWHIVGGALAGAAAGALRDRGA